MQPKLLIFASGTTTGGGSGFKKLVEAAKRGTLKAEIAGVVCNYEIGGVREKADALGVPFIHMAAPFTTEKYQEIARQSGADFFALSGWLKMVRGLDLNTRFSPKTVFNIHPGPLPQFGGEGMYGHHVHEAVIAAYKRGEVIHSAVTMHFVTEKYDEGPIFFQLPVEIQPTDTAEDLSGRVNAAEHDWQPIITNLVVQGEISWDGIHSESLTVPPSMETRAF